MRVITLGEILLRFSTSEEIRIKNTDEFRVCYGGAETNVGISLSQFGQNVSRVVLEKGGKGGGERAFQWFFR